MTDDAPRSIVDLFDALKSALATKPKRVRPHKVHFSGGARWTGESGHVNHCLPGAVLCRTRGEHTGTRADVTCRRCLFFLLRADGLDREAAIRSLSPATTGGKR